MGGFLTFLAFIFLAFVGFVIYFIFKQMQFVIQAVDLYKDMVLRLDKIIEILSSNSTATTKVSASLPSSSGGPAALASPTAQQKPDSGPRGICPNCDSQIALNSAECPKCKAQFGGGSAWKVKLL